MKTLAQELLAHEVKTVCEQKAHLRRAMQARREALSETERADSSRAICRRLSELPMFAARRGETLGVVAVYLATPDEANVDEFASALLARGVPVAAPVLAPKKSEPVFRRLRSLSAVYPGQFGIRYPRALAASASSPESDVRDAVEIEDIAVILVAGLAFDRSGARLGRGGGWYDRVLSHIKERGVPAIGVCFKCQLVPDVPCEPHDQRVSVIVTEVQTIGLTGTDKKQVAARLPRH